MGTVAVYTFFRFSVSEIMNSLLRVCHTSVYNTNIKNLQSNKALTVHNHETKKSKALMQKWKLFSVSLLLFIMLSPDSQYDRTST